MDMAVDEPRCQKFSRTLDDGNPGRGSRALDANRRDSAVSDHDMCMRHRHVPLGRDDGDVANPDVARNEHGRSRAAAARTATTDKSEGDESFRQRACWMKSTSSLVTASGCSC